MRKIIVGARVSMDGIMQEPMEPSERFKLGGWARTYQDQDCAEEFDRLYFSEKFDLLLGRTTYEIFARYCPFQVWEDSPNGGLGSSSSRSRST
jgi:dihydrofolate reductase